MSFRRVLLSGVLVGGCVWCLGLMQQAHSGQGTGYERQAPQPQRAGVSAAGVKGAQAADLAETGRLDIQPTAG